jgi:HK97 family phage prohead protease
MIVEVLSRDTETLSLPLEIKADSDPGCFSGYGAVFGNKDRDGDVITPGAFAASLKARKPILLWQHDTKSPIGAFDEVREDGRGLYVKGRLSMEGKGAEAYSLLKLGALNGLSIGFVTREACRDSVKGARVITKADLMEVSLVTFPANELARVESVKTADHGGIDNARSFERLLRENGFSRSRAKAITAKGFKASDISAGESAEIASLIYALKSSKQRLESKRFLEKLRFSLPPAWTAWQPFAVITTEEPSSFAIKVRHFNLGKTKHPFQLEVKYVSPQGSRTFLWQSSGNPSRGKRYPVPAGIQELQVRGRSLGIFPQDVEISLDRRR